MGWSTTAKFSDGAQDHLTWHESSPGIWKAQAQTCPFVSCKMLPGDAEADPLLRTCDLYPSDHCCSVVSLLWSSLCLMSYVLVKWQTSPTPTVLDRRRNLLAHVTRKPKDRFGIRTSSCLDSAAPMVSWWGFSHLLAWPPRAGVFLRPLVEASCGQLLCPRNLQVHQKVNLYFSTVWMKFCDLIFSLV